MPDRDSVINDLNVAKLILCNPQTLTPEMCIRIGQAITSAIAMLKEQQEAMEPIEEFRKSTNCRVYHCKRCGHIVGTILGGKHPITKLAIEHFCDVCGQAVKWE